MGIPLYQIMEVHKYIEQVKHVLPQLDQLRGHEPGSGTIAFWRKAFTSVSDYDLIILARALAGLIGCDRVIGLVEIPVNIEGDVTVLKPFATIPSGEGKQQ